MTNLTTKSFKKNSILILSSLLFILISIASLNIFINPYGFYGSSQKSVEILNARELKYNDVSQLEIKPQAFVFGSSNSMRFLPSSIEKQTKLNAYNYGLFYATAEDYYSLPKTLYQINEVEPKLIIFCLDVFSFIETPESFDEVFRGAKNRLSYYKNASKYLPDFSQLKLLRYRLKSAFTFKQSLRSIRALIDKDLTPLSEKNLFNKTFLEKGVRKIYNDFEGNNVTLIAEEGRYDIESYIKRKDLEFSKARNGYKGIVSVLGNYDFKELSERRLALFEKSIKYLNARNCKVIINLMPVQPYFDKLLSERTNHHNNVANLNTFCKSLSEKYRNIILVKDNSHINNFKGKPKHFFDSYHPTSVNSNLMIESLNLSSKSF